MLPRMARLLMQQALALPVLFFVPVLVAGFLVEGYSAIGQQASEITLTESGTAISILNSGAILSGASCLLLALGISLSHRRFYLTSIVLAVFGVSMVFNGLYPMGSLMHGLYGSGLSLMILPFVACYELKNESVAQMFFPVSLAAGFVIFTYSWSMLVGLDPADYRGLTQRLASIVIFGWIAFLAWQVSRSVAKPAPQRTKSR
jgi:hypothetical protein